MGAKTGGRTTATIAIARIAVAAINMATPASPAPATADLPLDLTQYRHSVWTASEGIRGSTRSIVQTTDGYLWIGNDFGLVRFDGVQFVSWSPPKGQHLPNGTILALSAAREGDLWIGTLGGLASWKNGTLTHYAELAGEPVFALLEDREGTIWVGGRGKICAIRNGKIQCYSGNGNLGEGVHSLSGNLGGGVYSLYEDGAGKLWVGSESGLWRWKPGPPQRYMPQPITMLQAVVQGDDGTGLTVINGIPARRTLRRIIDAKNEKYSLSEGGKLQRPYRLLRDRRGALWIGTVDRGLLHVYQGKTTKFSQSDGLSSDIVMTLFEDREGSIWVGTVNGLDRFREPAVSTISTNQGLSGAATSVAAASDGAIWIGTVDGLNRWHNGQMTVYRSDSEPAGSRTKHEVKVREIRDRGLPDNQIGSLLEDRRGRLWVTTREGTAWLEDGRFTRATGLPAGFATAIMADRNDVGVWVAYPRDGMFHVVAGRVTESTPWPWSGAARDPRLSAIVPDPVTRGLWLGFLDGGIARFSNGQIGASLGSKDGLGADLVWNLQIDHERALWTATQGGLSRIKDGRVETLTSKNGLPCDNVQWVMQDEALSMWLYTACGLVRIARNDLAIWITDSKRSINTTLFEGADGVRMHAMLTGFTPVVSRSSDGKIWFAHLDGVGVIDPHHLAFNSLPPAAHVEQIIGDREVHWRNTWGAAALNLRLAALTRDLEIDFTALSLVAPEKNRFRYKLDNYDHDWHDAGNRHQAFYNNLSPGNYRFRVAASNNSGVWNESGDTLEFSISPAYYQTAWFLALCVAASFGFVWALYRYRIHQIAREFNARLEGRIDERLRVCRELHDTLLQNFQGALFEFQAARNLFSRRPEQALETLDNAIGSGRQAIKEGRNALQDLRSQTIEGSSLEVLLTAAAQELAAVQHGTAGSTPFRVSVEGAPKALSPLFQDEVYRISREVLRNAFQHAQASLIEVEVRYDNRLFRLRIRDDGIGIDRKVLREGARPGHFGLPGMRERTKRIGARLTIWSEIGAGTEVELTASASIAYTKSNLLHRFGVFELWRSGDRRN